MVGMVMTILLVLCNIGIAQGRGNCVRKFVELRWNYSDGLVKVVDICKWQERYQVITGGIDARFNGIS